MRLTGPCEEPVELNLGAKGRNRSVEASSRAPCEGGPGQCQVWGAGACSQRENPEGDGSKARGVTGRCGLTGPCEEPVSGRCG